MTTDKISHFPISKSKGAYVKFLLVLNKGRAIIFLSGGGTFFVKKLLASCSWLKKNCLLQGYEGKKLSAKQREVFSNTLIFQNFDTNWTRHKSVFQFHLLY